jgi:hypothetical protein
MANHKETGVGRYYNVAACFDKGFHLKFSEPGAQQYRRRKKGADSSFEFDQTF